MLRRHGVRGRIEVIENGVDFNFFSSGNAKRVRKKYGKNIVLFVGRLAEEKNLELLIRAAKGSSYKFVLVGTGPVREYLEHMVGWMGLKNVVFTGYVPDSELPDFYSAASVFVLPSLSDTYGIVLIEAMSAGCPVIGVDVGGIPDVINGRGILIRPRVSELRRAIENVIQNKKLRSKLKRKGRSFAKSLAWNRVAEKFIRLYEEVI
jgi:glycosyltransferase involved in cell wall biosynthesis